MIADTLAPTTASIHAVADKLLHALQPSLAAAAGGVLPPRDPLLLSGMPESTQTILSRAVFQKRLREALREDEYGTRFCNPAAPISPSQDLPAEDWDLLFTRRRILALLRPGANSFLSTRPADTPFCSTDMWSIMMRIYLGCFVYDDSTAQSRLRCGSCDEPVLDKLGVHATTNCANGWGRHARHDRQATIFLKWLAAPAGLAYQGKYGQGEAVGLLFGTQHRPADALVFPPPPAPGEDPGRPTAIDFLITGAFSTTSATGRRQSRNSASSPHAITAAGETAKASGYIRKVRAAWKIAFPGVPCPGSSPEAPLPPGGLEEVTGLQFRAAVFETFGGCSDGTTELLMSYAKRVADRQGTTPKRVYDHVYGRLSYSIWSSNAQAVILLRTKSVWPTL